jgi:uncharacterized membrane protein YdbT with pleckstrin-like domain
MTNADSNIKTQTTLFKINPTLKITKIFLIFAFLGLILMLKNKFLGLISLPFFILAAFQAISRKLSVFTLTDLFISSEVGLVSKRIVSIPLNRIQNVSLRIKFFQRLINVGEVVVESAGEEEKEDETKVNEIILSGIDRPKYYYKMIMEKIGQKL